MGGEGGDFMDYGAILNLVKLLLLTDCCYVIFYEHSIIIYQSHRAHRTQTQHHADQLHQSATDVFCGNCC